MNSSAGTPAADPDFVLLLQLLALLPPLNDTIAPGEWWARYGKAIEYDQSYIGSNLYAHPALAGRPTVSAGQVADLASKCISFFHVADVHDACVVLDRRAPGALPPTAGAFGRLWASEVSRLALTLYARYRVPG